MPYDTPEIIRNVPAQSDRSSVTESLNNVLDDYRIVECKPTDSDTKKLCIEPVVREEQTESGDIFVKNGPNEALALNTGEGIKVGPDGSVTTFSSDGNTSSLSDKPVGEITGRKPVDFGTLIYANGVHVRSMVDGTTRVEFPSGSAVTIRGSRIQSVDHPSASEHLF